MVKINSVMHGSPADLSGVKSGDILVEINGHGIKDVLDYMYYAADTDITVKLERNDKPLTINISKDEYDDLGLEFETFLMDQKQSCSNKCVFCFIDQMPPGMRSTSSFTLIQQSAAFGLETKLLSAANCSCRKPSRQSISSMFVQYQISSLPPVFRQNSSIRSQFSR